MYKFLQKISISNQINNNTKLISSIYNNINKRYFLSNSYNLNTEFQSRLDNNIIKKINPSSFYLELDQQYNKYKTIYSIDVDMYISSVSSDIHIEQVEDILYKFRLSPTTIDILDSTPHTVIRLLVEWNKISNLIQILDDRLNYGIFPDDYCNNLLLNYFITNKNYRDGAKIACIQMLQEDFSNEITKYLSIYTCLKYIENPDQPWIDLTSENITNEDKNENDDEDEDEEIKIRVKYLRNKYFDYHFDLKKSNDLIGKTLITIGRYHNDDILLQSIYLIGLSLMKNDKNIIEINQFLDNINNDKNQVTKDSLLLVKKFIVINDLNEINEQTVETKTDGESKGDGEVKADGEGAGEISEEIKNILLKVDSIINKGKDIHLIELVENKTKEIVNQFEKEEIEKQKEVYKKWELDRESILQEHIENLKQKEIFNQIEKKKLELAQEEEKIFFFDNENSIDLELEKKYPKKEEIIVKKRNEFDGMRNKGRINVHKVKKQVIDDNYIPPEMHKPYKNTN